MEAEKFKTYEIERLLSLRNFMLIIQAPNHSNLSLMDISSRLEQLTSLRSLTLNIQGDFLEEKESLHKLFDVSKLVNLFHVVLIIKSNGSIDRLA